MIRDEDFAIRLLTFFAGIPFRLRPTPTFQTPQKILILKPCCLSQVMLATPLLAALNQAFPSAQIDWAVSDWARPAIASNPRLTKIINAGNIGTANRQRKDMPALIEQLKREKYDTCFMPARSSLLAYIAWRAGIPQRVGLTFGGRGFAHTIAVTAGTEQMNEALLYLKLAQVAGIQMTPPEEFHPSDGDRIQVTRLLAEQVGWLGDSLLVILHPGGGHNPKRQDEKKRWQLERFVRLGNYLGQEKGATVILAGGEHDQPITRAVAGLMSVKVHDIAGKLSLGELGALCETAGLYVGNDAGSTHISAAVGCPTIGIYPSENAGIARPFVALSQFIPLEGDISLSHLLTAIEQLL